jgi:hypothetical protein
MPIESSSALNRTVEEFEAMKRQLATSSVDGAYMHLDLIAALLVVAAKLDALENAIIISLPKAGEGP